MKPEGVKLILRNGIEIPCDVKSLGINNEGIELWEPIIEGDINTLEIVNVYIHKLPAKTGITFPKLVTE